MSNISPQKNARTPEQNISLRNLRKHFWLEETAILDVQMSKLPMISGYEFHRRTGGGRNETLFNDIVSPIMGWYMFNGLEHTAILSHFLTFITGSSSRLLRIRFSADLTMYWFPVRHFRCMNICLLVIWIWNQNISISTIVGTSSHIICVFFLTCFNLFNLDGYFKSNILLFFLTIYTFFFYI